MFTLRETHQTSFQNKAESEFVLEVMQYLREDFPDLIPNLANNRYKIKELNEISLKLFCEIAITVGRKRGLVGNRGIKIFISYMVILGCNFYEYVELKHYFLPFNENPDQSILRLVYLGENEWKSIKNFCNSNNLD